MPVPEDKIHWEREEDIDWSIFDWDAWRKRMRELDKQANGDYETLKTLAMKEFPGIEKNFYIATEFLHRPENYN